MKKILCLLSLVSLFATQLCAQSRWTDPQTGISWTYTNNTDDTVSIGWYKKLNNIIVQGQYLDAISESTSGTITIPTEINGKRVKSIRPLAFDGTFRIHLIIPQGIRLEEYALAYSTMTSVTFLGTTSSDRNMFYSSEIGTITFSQAQL